RQQAVVSGVGPDEPVAANLWRVHWFNDGARTDLVRVPGHIVLPRALTGVEAKIVVALGDRFPMIGAHKVLAAYACLVPRVVGGSFDPTASRAIWPSTGNYCRGGVAISRIMGCHGVAVLPEGMSRERFDWLERWVADPADIVRTPGVESNVKEIYDECKRLAEDPENVILNQFSEYPNHLVHELVTGRALAHVFETMREVEPSLRLRAFVAATGSAGTIAAGDHLKDRYGAAIAAAEALECPTLLRNGFGEHNIQGIGDKHVPLIHNVMNTDLVVDVSDRDTDALNVLFNTVEGRAYLRGRGLGDDTIAALDSFGLSSICNVLAAIKVAKLLRMGPEDVIVTVATDGAAMYRTEVDKVIRRDFPSGFGRAEAAEIFGRSLEGTGTGDMRQLTDEDRERIFNLGYFTWVEQQGISIEDFVAGRDRAFWLRLRELVPAWDEAIRAFNARTGMNGAS
ncbi:MAG: pyridoxal-phosphate dependent enzyme, partial [Actinomycetota bacterium]